jgi:hypothetical protein
MDRIISIALAVVILAIITTSVQSADASTTFSDGQRAGKAKGHSGAMTYGLV